VKPTAGKTKKRIHLKDLAMAGSPPYKPRQSFAKPPAIDLPTSTNMSWHDLDQPPAGLAYQSPVLKSSPSSEYLKQQCSPFLITTQDELNDTVFDTFADPRLQKLMSDMQRFVIAKDSRIKELEVENRRLRLLLLGRGKSPSKF